MTSLFRGMGAPFATVAVYNAVLFAARGQMESILAHADGALKLWAVCSLSNVHVTFSCAEYVRKVHSSTEMQICT